VVARAWVDPAYKKRLLSTQLARTIEVTTKTIQRDIDYMHYQLNVPIEFGYARGGYYFTKPMTELPLFQLTEAELVSISVAR
jgi:predicted DNA-binding transcriptional regulator YafY